MEPDIENMTLNEYLEYEAKKERRLRKSARSKRIPNIYEEVDFNSFHRDKSRAFDYPHYHEDIEINKYHGLPPLHPCFQPAQPYTEDGLVSSYTSDEVDIDSMTIEEYELYIAKQELSFEEDYNNLVRMGVKNLRKQAEAKAILTPTIHTLPELGLVVQPCVPLLPSPNEVKVVREEEPNNDVDSISIQVPLIPQIIHTTPPDKDYVAPTTNPIFDELLEEFRDGILNIIMADEEANFNPTMDIEELERLITYHESSFTEIKVLSRIVRTNVEHETFIRQMNPLYRLGQSAKSSTKTDKKWGMAISCKEAFQARLVGCYTKDDDVACDCGCYSRKQTWSMA
ncbi:hypothetical protein Tco_1290103 [Tanacetum coccineum]